MGPVSQATQKERNGEIYNVYKSLQLLKFVGQGQQVGLASQHTEHVIRVCYTTVAGQSAVLSLFKLSNLKLKTPTPEKSLDFSASRAVFSRRQHQQLKKSIGSEEKNTQTANTEQQTLYKAEWGALIWS